jgi:hypothetical protein
MKEGKKKNRGNKDKVNIYTSRFNDVLDKVISDKTWKPLYKEEEEEKEE